MNELAITAIEIDSSGRLLVRPLVETGALYEYIYREANGLRWHREKHVFYAYEPLRWGHEELLRHIAATVRSAFGEQLRITAETAWVGVAPELEHKLRRVLSQGPPSP